MLFVYYLRCVSDLPLVTQGLCFFSAMIVRYLTRRFIGDYEPNTGAFLFLNTSLQRLGEISECMDVEFCIDIWVLSPYPASPTLFMYQRALSQAPRRFFCQYRKDCTLWCLFSRRGSTLCLIVPVLYFPFLPPLLFVESAFLSKSYFILISTGNLYSRLVPVEGDQMFLQIQDTPGCIEVGKCSQVYLFYWHS